MPQFQPPANAPLTPSLRAFLYFTATITGAVVLVVEILGAKMLTPWFGSSHFVWTAQIAITLLALAAGYYLGGWTADRYRRLALVYVGLVAAAAYLALTILTYTKLAALCLELDLALGSMVASLVLFFVPLTLLAAVGPYFIRAITPSVADVGRTVGRLSALSTVGSVLGVLITSYVLVPYLSNSVSMLGTAGVLVLLAFAYFLRWGFDDPGRSLAVAGTIAAVILGYAGLRREEEARNRSNLEVARSNSHFGMLQVFESREGRRRYYLNDFLVQNTYDPVDKQSRSMFTYALYHLSRGYTPQLRSALCIGMGVGIVPRALAHDGISVDVVEINPAVVPIAQRWFDFDPSAVRLVIDDARHFLRVATNRYDTIHLDAFLGDSSPSHLMTREAFQEIRNLLNPEGTLVINSFAYFEEGRDFFGTSLHRTLKSVFGEVLVHASPNGNTLFVASDRTPLTFRRPTSFADVHPTCRAELEAALAAPQSVVSDHGLVLTDNYNPVDYFDAENRERTRRLLASGIGMW